jgi:hypothetical protein
VIGFQGRKKICEGRNVSMVLEEEIQQLVEKLDKLQRNLGGKNMEVRKSSNFDKQTCLLKRRLEKFRGMSDEICVKEIQEMAEASLSLKTSCRGSDNLVSSGKSNVRVICFFCKLVSLNLFLIHTAAVQFLNFTKFQLGYVISFYLQLTKSLWP